MSIKKRVKRLEKYFQQQDEPPKALMDFRWSGPQPGGDCVAFQIVDKCGDVTRIDCLPDESMDEVWPIAQAVAADPDAFNRRVPVGRLGTTEEIANVVVFLASQRASYMTGATVDVSGGLAMH